MNDKINGRVLPKTKQPSLAGSLVSGTGWTVAIRWGSKFLGIISLAICARILTPEDYGLVNMAMVAIGFSQVLVQFGLDASLVRNQSATAEHYNTAWSLKIIQSSLITLIVMISAPIAEYITKDERVMPIMVTIGVSGWIGGLQNIYVVNFLKNLDFRKDFLFSFIPRIVSFVLSVSSVIILKSYWGLVIGICSAEIARMIISYTLIKQRANWSLAEWREMTGFSLFYFLDGLAQYSVYQLDRLIVGYLGGASKVGIYGVAREVAALPSTELVLPIGRALVPTLASLNDDPTRQSAAIEKAIGGVMLVAVPVAVGFALIAREFVLVFFGNKWIDVIPLVAILSFAAMTSGFRSTAQNVLFVIGKIRLNAILSWIYSGVVLLLIYPSFYWWGLNGICWLYAISGLMMTIVLGLIMKSTKSINGLTVWMDISRTLLSAGMMYMGVTACANFLPSALPVLLASKIVLGAAIYGLSVFLFWILMGKPNSSERIILDMIIGKFGRNIFHVK